MRLGEARLVLETAVVLIVRRLSFDNKGVAALQERNPEAVASVKDATRPSSYREHRPANGEGNSAFRQKNQAFPWKRLIQRIAPLPVEGGWARSRQRLTLDARGRGLDRLRIPGATLVGVGGGSGLTPQKTPLTY